MGVLTLDLSSLDPAPRRVFVGVSGGLDSMVLLDLVYQASRQAGFQVTVLHVHHHLQSAADAWLLFVSQYAQKYGFEIEADHLDPQQFQGENVEAVARAGRYAFFEKHLIAPDDYLFLAHHAQDQVETFFLNLQRGAGLAGLTAMPHARPFGAGQLVRPLLHFFRADLEAYAKRQQLEWVEDPSNQNTNLNRNFLRVQILPLLRERWPHFDAQVGNAISHLQEAREMLAEYLHEDVKTLGLPLDLKVFKAFPATLRQKKAPEHSSWI